MSDIPCPHCSKSHPAGTPFCPATGKRIRRSIGLITGIVLMIILIIAIGGVLYVTNIDLLTNNGEPVSEDDQGRVDKLRFTINKLQKEKLDQIKAADELKKAVATLKVQIGLLEENLETQIKEAEESAERNLKTITKLRKEIVIANGRAEKPNQTVTKLRTELRAADRSIAELRRANEDKKAIETELRRELSKCKINTENPTQTVTKLQTELRAATRSVTELKKQVKRANKNKSDLEKKLSKCKKKIPVKAKPRSQNPSRKEKCKALKIKWDTGQSMSKEDDIFFQKNCNK